MSQTTPTIPENRSDPTAKRQLRRWSVAELIARASEAETDHLPGRVAEDQINLSGRTRMTPSAIA